MRRLLPILTLLLAAGSARANGLLIPEDKNLPPLAMVNHRVTVAIDERISAPVDCSVTPYDSMICR